MFVPNVINFDLCSIISKLYYIPLVFKSVGIPYLEITNNKNKTGYFFPGFDVS